MYSVAGTWGSSQGPHSGISTTPKFDGSSQPQFRSHTVFRRHLSPQSPKSYNHPELTRLRTEHHSRDDPIHHHEQIETNFFETQNLLRDSILFLVQSRLTTQQAVEDSNRSPLQHTNPNYMDMILAVTSISIFKPNS